MTIQPISNEDIMVWPDGTFCCRLELPEYGYMGDDYVTHPVGSPEWKSYMQEEPKASCSCPSGDGSLRWPCQVHPPRKVKSHATH